MEPPVSKPCPVDPRQLPILRYRVPVDDAFATASRTASIDPADERHVVVALSPGGVEMATRLRAAERRSRTSSPARWV